jgi:hypothetical protein
LWLLGRDFLSLEQSRLTRPTRHLFQHFWNFPGKAGKRDRNPPGTVLTHRWVEGQDLVSTIDRIFDRILRGKILRWTHRTLEWQALP